RKPPEYYIPLTHPLELAPFSVGINTGENIAERFGVTREQQDEWALRSHQRAVAAIDENRFQQEIAPVPVSQKRGDPVSFIVDERPRRDTSLEKLASLPPAYKEGGTVTAGNASGRNDAAAALVVTSASKADTLGLRPR